MPRLGAGDAGRATGSATLGRRAGPPACYCSDVRFPPACTRADATGVPMSDGSLTIAARSYAAVMALAPAPLAARCAAMAARIPEAALAGPGREAMPHVTVRWGLDDAAAPAIRAALAGWPGPARARLGRTSAWPTPDGDCVKLDVLSPDLAELRQLIELACPEAATTFPFDPHLTLAYVESGRGAEFAGWDDLAGVIVEFTELVIGLTDDNQEVVPLGSRIVGASGFDPNQPRDEDGRWTETDTLTKLDGFLIPSRSWMLSAYFHGTASEALASIKKHGLVPAGGRGGDAWARENGWYRFGDRTAAVYLAADSKTAKQYATYAVEANPGSAPVLLAIKVPSTAKSRIASDEFENQGYRFDGTIPPDWIRVIGADGSMRALGEGAEDVTLYAVLITKEEPVSFVGAEFDPNQPRDENGRWTAALSHVQQTYPYLVKFATHIHFNKGKGPGKHGQYSPSSKQINIWEGKKTNPTGHYVELLVHELTHAKQHAESRSFSEVEATSSGRIARWKYEGKIPKLTGAEDPLPSRYRLSKFAAEHAAELVQAPRRVRTLIRNEVRKALRNGEGPEGIADRLDGLVAMEPARIDTIARTEYAIARTGARLEEAAALYGDTEVVKGWVLGDESCPRCIALAGQEVPLDEDFVTEDGERVMGPPLHPNCDCDIEIREVGERERLRAAGITLVGAEFDESKHPRGPDGRWIDGSGGVFRDSKVSDADFKSFEAAVDALPKRTQQKVKHLMLTVVGSLSDYGATHSAGEVYGSRGGPYIRVKAHDPEGMKAVLYHEIGHAIAGDLANRPDVLEAFNAEREGKSGQMWYYATKPEEAVVQSFAYHLGATDSDRKTFTTKAFKNTHKAVERYIQFFKDGEIKAAPRPADMRLAPKRKSTETLAEKRARISAKFKAERRRLEGVSLIGAAEWDESKHPRVPAGDSDGGQFTEAGASANVVQLHQYTGGADKIGFEQSHAEMQRLIAAADSDATLRGAALIARWYSSATQLQGLITREVIAQALQGKPADQIEADPAFIKVRDAFNEFRNPDFLFTRKDLEDLVAAAPAYYASLRQIGPTIDTVYRGMKGTPGRSDEFELRGPTAFSHSRDIAMSYSGGTLLEIKPGAKMLPTDLLSQVSEARDNINALGKARSEAAPYMTLPAFYTRSDKRSHPLPGHGFQMGLDTDAELMSSGRFRILGREKRSVSFEDALTGKRRAKSVNVITVEQIGVF